MTTTTRRPYEAPTAATIAFELMAIAFFMACGDSEARDAAKAFETEDAACGYEEAVLFYDKAIAGADDSYFSDECKAYIIERATEARDEAADEAASYGD